MTTLDVSFLKGNAHHDERGRFASANAASEAAGEHGAQAFKQALPSGTDTTTRRTAASIGREAITYLHDRATALASKARQLIQGTQLVSLSPTHAGGVEIRTSHALPHGSVESKIQLHERDVDGGRAKAAIRSVHDGLRAIGVPPVPASFSGDIRFTR